ncbi:hypothetical protein K3G39_10525 [Pontibacter sp. HSC-14F20]|uniref:hypothetical protein n=1 Tax=Pontibacter sp. HSC-14F20 TaxID=2864136 RepID=UPI001C72A76F|nr:hypothetical protein [Pontibacter sp. HSC-14F20]MBX0333672.1 hypothetical protein [Pontibacter sp. HSC-14F20]
MENTLMVKGYLIYLPIALLMTVLVARTLFKNSQIFMLDIFNGREEIAMATNRLFEIGFYLMNIGAALLILKMNGIFMPQDLIEALSHKLGGFSIYLGIMLFLNLYLFFRGKRKATEKVQVSEVKA